MNKESNKDLLIDLARLVKKHPPEEWESVINWFKDEERREKLLAIIQELAGVSKKIHDKSRRKRNIPGIAYLLDEVRQIDPQKAELLRQFWNKLRSREVLPTFSTMRMFAEAAGLPIISAKKREQAVNELMRQFMNLPYDEIQDTLQKALIARSNFGEDYGRWVDLILGNRSDR
jgi:alanyl-tRNA synthetase